MTSFDTSHSAASRSQMVQRVWDRISTRAHHIALESSLIQDPLLFQEQLPVGCAILLLLALLFILQEWTPCHGDLRSHEGATHREPSPDYKRALRLINTGRSRVLQECQ